MTRRQPGTRIESELSEQPRRQKTRTRRVSLRFVGACASPPHPSSTSGRVRAHTCGQVREGTPLNLSDEAVVSQEGNEMHRPLLMRLPCALWTDAEAMSGLRIHVQLGLDAGLLESQVRFGEPD